MCHPPANHRRGYWNRRNPTAHDVRRSAGPPGLREINRKVRVLGFTGHYRRRKTLRSSRDSVVLVTARCENRYPKTSQDISDVVRLVGYGSAKCSEGLQQAGLSVGGQVVRADLAESGDGFADLLDVPFAAGAHVEVSFEGGCGVGIQVAFEVVGDQFDDRVLTLFFSASGGDARRRDVLSIAQVTNDMATTDDDFEKARPTVQRMPLRSSLNYWAPLRSSSPARSSVDRG